MSRRVSHRRMAGQPFDIVAYQWRADIYTPEEIIEAMMMNAGVGIHLWPRLEGLSAEEALDLIAADMDIDRMDEYSFDSDDFPKVVFRNHYQPGDVDERGGDMGYTAHRRTARRLHAAVSKSDAQAVVDAILAQYPFLAGQAPAPTLMREWVPGADWTVIWEEGPYEWTYLFPYGGIEEEWGSEVEDVFALLPDSVFVEAETHYSLNIYPSSVLD